jgi:hypothetical protein
MGRVLWWMINALDAAIGALWRLVCGRYWYPPRWAYFLIWNPVDRLYYWSFLLWCNAAWYWGSPEDIAQVKRDQVERARQTLAAWDETLDSKL